jgi:hypothetical protein
VEDAKKDQIVGEHNGKSGGCRPARHGPEIGQNRAETGRVAAKGNPAFFECWGRIFLPVGWSACVHHNSDKKKNGRFKNRKRGFWMGPFSTLII